MRQVERQGQAEHAPLAHASRRRSNSLGCQKIERAKLILVAKDIPGMMLAGHLDDRQFAIPWNARFRIAHLKPPHQGSRVRIMPLPRSIGEPSRTMIAFGS